MICEACRQPINPEADVIRHHIRYTPPEIVIKVHASCHRKIHGGEAFQHLKPVDVKMVKHRTAVMLSGGGVMMTRKVMKIGGSRAIALPPAWMERHGIEDGAEVMIAAASDIRICAPGKSKEIYDKITQVVKEADTDKEKEDIEA